MNKRLLPCLTVLCVSLLTATPISGQITMGSSELLALLGSSVESISDTTFSVAVDVGSAGENQTWDLTGITLMGDIISQAYVDPGDTPYFATFPGSNFAIYITSPAFEGVELYQYSEVTASAFQDLGAVFNFGEEDSTAFFTDRSPVPLPVSYGTSFSDVERDTTEGPGFMTVSVDSSESHVDGWGTVTVDAGSFDALRLRSHNTFIFQTYANDVLVTSDTTQQVGYDWITREALVIASMYSEEGNTDPNFTVAEEVQIASAVSVSVDDVRRPETGALVASAYPNPFAEQVTFEIATASRGVDAAVFDVLGRRIRTIYAPDIMDGTLTLRWDGMTDDGTPSPNGIYFLRVDDGVRAEARKVILVR